MAPRKVVFFGDSHTHAVIRALREATPSAVLFEVLQMKREKNGREMGDVTVDEARRIAGALGRDDLVISLMGGNQHQVLGLVQHEVPFDFFADPSDEGPRPGAQVIPRRALRDLLLAALSGKDWLRLAGIVDGAICRICHMVPPPPKEDEAHILRRHESAFVSGVLARGISPAPLRLKLWRLQVDALRELGRDAGVEILPPPPGTQTEAGFLKPEYYADDATHGNAAYGSRILEVATALVARQGAATEVSG